MAAFMDRHVDEKRAVFRKLLHHGADRQRVFHSVNIVFELEIQGYSQSNRANRIFIADMRELHLV